MKLNFTALTRSALITIWVTVIGAIGAELYAPLKNWFTKLGGHHWTGKSIVAVALFFVAYLVFMNMREKRRPEKGIRNIVISAVAGGLLIFAFFVWHYFEG